MAFLKVMMKKIDSQDVFIKELTTTRGSNDGYHDVSEESKHS